MMQRREVRIQANQSVAVTLFGEPDIRSAARIKNISGKGIGIEVDGPVALGTALRVELEDALLLGEVIYCRKDESTYYVGVELEHSLCGLGELSRMVDAFNTAMTPLDSGPQSSPESSPQRGHARVDSGDQRHKQSH